MGFKVELFNDYAFSYIMHGLLDKSKDVRRFDDFFRHALEARKHWRILEFFDGNKEHDNEEKRKQIQWNTFKCFHQEEVQDYYNAAVNMAISGDPYPGHDVLFERVANDKNSMFYDSITPEFQKRLNNGRFWELLNELSPSLNYGLAYSKMEDILINHFNDLDIQSIPKNINEKFRGISYLGGGDWESRGVGLSQRAIRQYANFLENIDKNLSDLKISKESFSKLVTPYIETLFGEDKDENPLMDDFEERLKSPLVEKYKNYLEPANF
ncbi:MAG: hypothetical protein ABIE36_03150 [Candidatus Diapherotrites archaeon]